MSGQGVTTEMGMNEHSWTFFIRETRSSPLSSQLEEGREAIGSPPPPSNNQE